jgi:mono/diheme cytochrome c family protein
LALVARHGVHSPSMTEVPDYLLERSRARRAALGLAPAGGPPGAGDDAPAPRSEAAAPAPAESSTAVAPAASAPAGAVAVAEAPPEAPVVPVAPAHTGPRSGIPVWMMPVILVLPFWAVVYLGAFQTPKSTGPLTPEQLGAQVYARAGCSGCHGARGEGGVGPKLAGGDAKQTFPNEADQIAWVETGSAPVKGQTYGATNHGPASGGMPAFKAQLSADEIKAVVLFERERL